MKETKAFTLIELLVVIAIIAILAAILFPVFAQAKLAAKKTVAISNAKQTALALQMYGDDNDDTVIKAYFGAPAGCDWGNIQADHWYTWRVAVQPYMKSINLLSDPTNQFSGGAFYENQVAPFLSTPPPQLMPTNFALNDAVSGVANGQCIGTHDSVVGTLTNLNDPAGTILAASSNGRTPTVQFWWGSTATIETGSILDGSIWCIATPTVNALTSPTGYVCPAVGVSALHQVNKQITFVWCDGHAKPQAYSQSLNPSSPTDSWDSQDQIMQNGNKGTQADRLLASQNMYPDLH